MEGSAPLVFARERDGELRRAAGMGLVLLATWGAYWLAFFPGAISPDPIAQLHELATNAVTSWHPFAHTLILKLCVSLVGSVAPLTLLQVLAAIFLYTLCDATLGRWGTPRWARNFLIAWLCVSPVFGYNLIAVWKDTLFALAAFALVVLLLLNALGYLSERFVVCGLAAVGICICLLRYNGPVLTLTSFLGVALVRSVRWRTVGLALVLILGSYPALSLGLGRLAAAKPANPVLAQHGMLHHVAAILSDPSASVPPEVSERLGRIMPIDQWVARYECVSGFRLIFDGGLISAPLLPTVEMAELWLKLVRANPVTVLRHWACASRYIWAVDAPLYIGPLPVEGSLIDSNQLGLQTEPIVSSANRVLSHVIVTTYGNFPWRALVWSPAFPLCVLLLSVAVGCIRQRSLWPAGVFMPILLNTLAWLVLASFPDLRFHFALVLAAPVSIAVAVLPRLAPTQRGAASVRS